MIQWAGSYDIQKQLLVVNLRQKDNTARTIFAPPGAGAGDTSAQNLANTQQLAQAQVTILGAQNNLINFWVSYEQFRLALYRDLGTIPYDEWEAYYELFLANSDQSRGGTAGANARPAAAGPAATAPVARR
jgi:hypothetical protein